MISREDLYALVWSKPMTKVAEQFEVSGSYMARVCSLLNVPRPALGYWAKKAVGKAPPQTPLPAPRPGDPLVWSREGEVRAPAKPEGPPRRPRRRRIAPPTDHIHGLIRGAKAHFDAGRPVEEGEYLKPYKKLLVDVVSSKACLDKALGFANDLFNALESVGHRVVLAPSGEQLHRREIEEREVPGKRREYYHRGPWSPYRPTLVYVGTVAIGLAVVEMSEDVLLRYVRGKYIREADYVPPKAYRGYVDHTWTTTQALPSGRLRLVAYSPYWRVAWSMTWQETKTAPLTNQMSAIVKALEDAAIKMVDLLKEADRQAEAERLRRLAEEERRRREEDRRRVAQSIKDSQAELSGVIQAWSNVMAVEAFFKGVGERAANLPDAERQAVLNRLELARNFLGTQNPLDFFISWRTPTERYRPLYPDADATAEGEEEQGDADEDEEAP